MSKKSPRITWKSIKVDIKKIDPTPKNYKISTDLGKERLQTSLEMFGLAGNVVLNYGAKGRFVLVDGNSRVEQAKERGEKFLWASVPNRKLEPKEFKEMSQMFDYAKAGEVDIERIQQDNGSAKDFFDRWGMTMPEKFMAKVAGNYVEEDDGTPAKPGKENGKALPLKAEEFLVNLFFTEKQEAEFRKMEDKIAAKLKTESTSDTVFQAFKQLVKKL